MTNVTREEGAYLSAIAAAQVDEPLPPITQVLYLMLAVLICAVTWASIARVDELTRSEGRVVPDGHEQVIASMEVGILRELLVHEGQQVVAGQDLVRLDPTRMESQENEGAIRRMALKATAARLTAEASGKPLQFPAELKEQPGLIAAETEAFEARRRVLDEAVSSMGRSQGLLMRELKMAQSMSAKGLMSDVEVMRLNRQVNELEAQRQDRIARFRQDASGELVKAQNELAVQDQQMIVRQDALTRTVLKSPVDGLVKNIRINTVGGVVTTGAPIMEIVPLGGDVLLEARIKPADIGFIHVGDRATIKVNGYDYNLFGGLAGEVEFVSPDSLGEGADTKVDSRYYRVLVRADTNTLKVKGKSVTVMPGMTASVEFKSGDRSVLSYLLRPMLKTREAMSER